MGHTDLIIHLPVPLKVGGILVEFSAVRTTHTVDHQMVVQVVGVHVGGHQDLIVRELLLRELDSDGVDLLGCQIIHGREGLDEVIELTPVRLLEAALGGDHLQVGGLGHAVVSGNHPAVTQHSFLPLDYILHHACHRSCCLLLVSHRCEGRHYRPPLAIPVIR